MGILVQSQLAVLARRGKSGRRQVVLLLTWHSRRNLTDRDNLGVLPLLGALLQPLGFFLRSFQVEPAADGLARQKLLNGNGGDPNDVILDSESSSCEEQHKKQSPVQKPG